MDRRSVVPWWTAVRGNRLTYDPCGRFSVCEPIVGIFQSLLNQYAVVCPNKDCQRVLRSQGGYQDPTLSVFQSGFEDDMEYDVVQVGVAFEIK